MNMLFAKKIFILLFVLSGLSACSTDESKIPSRANVGATLSLEGPHVMDEGGNVSIKLNISDDNTAYKNLVITLDDTDTKGTVILDVAAKRIFYTAPWLPVEKVLSTGFSLSVRDEDGVVTTETYSIEINDLTSLVMATMTPSTNTFKNKYNKENKTLYVWVFENSGDLKISYDVVDEDADNILATTTVSGLFKPIDLVVESTPKTTLSISLPEIDTPSKNGVLKLSLTDNDGVADFTTEVVVVNKVKLNWLSAITTISEKLGAEFSFNLNEDKNYPADYVVKFTYANGDDLDFILSYSIDFDTMTIMIPPLPPIIGDKSVKMSFSVRNKVVNSIGDEYVAETIIEKDINVIDDRDDVLGAKLLKYTQNIAFYEQLKSRRDEYAIMKTYSEYLFLDGVISLRERDDILIRTTDLLNGEYASLDNKINIISDTISSGGSSEQQQVLFDDFNLSLKNIGFSVRGYFNETKNKLSQNGVSIPFGDLVETTKAILVQNSLSAYVGQERYGVFSADKSSWYFNPNYKYLGSSNIINFSCN